MKNSLRKILSLALVIAVLMTSMIVSSVGAADPVTRDPMQKILLDALTLDAAGKASFNHALVTAGSNVTSGAIEMVDLFASVSMPHPYTMSQQDAIDALTKYKALTIDQKNLIQLSVLAFTLNKKSYDGKGFDTIIDKVNTEITGSASDDKGVSFIIQIIEYLNTAGKNGAWVTDVPSDTNKIAFGYTATDIYVKLAKDSIEGLISAMDTINAKLAGRTEATAFEKLLGYTADAINASGIPATERTALKTYLNGINDNYYIPYVAPTPQPPSTGGGTVPATDTISADVTKALADLNNAVTSGSGAVLNDLKKKAEVAIEKEIAKVGTTTITPKITGTTATITADQIKVADILAKADAVIAKVAEIEKVTSSAALTIEKKIVIDAAAKDVDKINVALPTELLTKVKEKGIQSIEVSTGDVKIDFTSDFAAASKSSSTLVFEVDKVLVNDELKAKMTDAQKAILASNPVVYDLSAKLISSTGAETKLTNFDKAIKIKIKYTLKAGEDKDNITVLFLSDDGSIQNMTAVYNETTGEIEFTTNHFSTYVVKNLVITFDDIKSGAWYKTQAESLASKGIVTGITGNNFAPNANVTRAEFIAMLVKAKGVYDKDATCKFTDVSKDAWYYTAVASAVKAGITAGIGNNKFAPNSLITREQMAVMLSSALGEKTIVDASKYLKATDANMISNFARNGMAVCVKNEFIGGIGSNKLDPKGNATRGMAAVVIYKYFNFIN